MTEYLHGIDVSHWQGTMDWHKAKAKGVQFAMIKATEGMNYVDTQFKANVDGCKAVDMPFGIYHFWRSMVTPIQQYDNIMRAVDYIGKLVPIAIDVEIFDGLKPEQNKNMLALLIQMIIEKTMKAPTLYTRKSIWDSNVAPYDRWKTLPLWVANYGVTSPALPRDWKSWYIWQYEVADAGPAYGAQSAKIDLNHVKPAYLDYYGIGVAHPEPEPQPQEYDITITLDGVTYSGKVTKG